MSEKDQLELEARDQDNRSRAMADATRKFLLAAHTGGIGLMGVFLTNKDIKLGPEAKAAAGFAAFFFVCGLLIAGLSLFRAKDGALKRRNNIIGYLNRKQYAKGLKEWPWFGVQKTLGAGKWLTDGLSFGILIVGAVTALLAAYLK